MKTLARWLLVLIIAAPLAAQAARAEGDAHFTDAELDRLLAPIALYPDTVLSHVLVASTYPLEVVQAARWSREHPDLRGQAAVDAAGNMDWDASVRALVAFPELLTRMDSDLDWTQDLGDAFLGNQGEVMDRVQFLRARASESGHLNEVEHERVVREREVIYIEPEVADVVYLPFYDPFVVYGDWWWPAYPPYRWAYWAGRPAAYYAYYGTFYWGVGFRLAPAFYFCDFDWPSRQVVVINDVHNNYYYGHHDHWHHDGDHDRDGSVWHHDPDHRRGVGYRDARLDDQWHHGYRRHDDDGTRGPWLAGGSSWRGGGRDGRQGHDGAGHDRTGHDGTGQDGTARHRSGHGGSPWGQRDDGGAAHGGNAGQGHLPGSGRDDIGRGSHRPEHERDAGGGRDASFGEATSGRPARRGWEGRASADGSVTVDRPAYGRSGGWRDSSPRDAAPLRAPSRDATPTRERAWGDAAPRAESHARPQWSGSGSGAGAPVREAPAEARGQGRVASSPGPERSQGQPRRNARERRGQAEP